MQFQVNDQDVEAQEIRVMDVFNYFKYAKRHNLAFDLVILDPPCFARSKKHTFSTAKDYPALLSEAIAITKDQCVIVASTNNASIYMKQIKKHNKQRFEKSRRSYHILE